MRQKLGYAWRIIYNATRGQKNMEQRSDGLHVKEPADLHVITLALKQVVKMEVSLSLLPALSHITSLGIWPQEKSVTWKDAKNKLVENAVLDQCKHLGHSPSSISLIITPWPFGQFKPAVQTNGHHSTDHIEDRQEEVQESSRHSLLKYNLSVCLSITQPAQRKFWHIYLIVVVQVCCASIY